MKERPILFSGAMVRALLDGSKTQTRRILKVQPDFSILKTEYRDPSLWEFRKRFMMYADDWSGFEHAMYRKTEPSDADLPVYQHRSPFGEPGDWLYVRETHRPVASGEVKSGYGEVRYGVAYQADGHVEWNSTTTKIYDLSGQPDTGPMQFQPPPWKPSIHMARRHSRITLEVTDVRVERLQDISEADAIAEGIETNDYFARQEYFDCVAPAGSHGRPRPITEYQTLWDSLNAARGYGWDANPWVWVIEFRRIECNT